MKSARLLISLSALGLLLAVAACGTKGSPFLPQENFSAGTTGLAGKRVNGEIILKGRIFPQMGSGEAADLIKGARVYYAQYPIEDAPCVDCPIEFRDHHTFGREVLTEQGFLCTLPGKDPGTAYFFRVHLVGTQGAMGPPSTVKVVVE